MNQQKKQESTRIQNSNRQLFNDLSLSIMPCKSQKQCNLPTPLTQTINIDMEPELQDKIKG
jgi:hypothetical protein